MLEGQNTRPLVFSMITMKQYDKYKLKLKYIVTCRLSIRAQGLVVTGLTSQSKDHGSSPAVDKKFLFCNSLLAFLAACVSL